MGNVKKKKPKDWGEIKTDFEAMQQFSCVPSDIFKVKQGHIFDEDQSVKWNKEQVEINNENYRKKVARLNTEKNRLRNAIYEDIYYSIQCEVGHGLSRNKAIAIWEYAFTNGHSSGYNEILYHLNALMELADKLLSEEVSK